MKTLPSILQSLYDSIETISENPEFHPKRTKLKGYQKEWKRNSFNKRRFKNKKKQFNN